MEDTYQAYSESIERARAQQFLVTLGWAAVPPIAADSFLRLGQHFLEDRPFLHSIEFLDVLVTVLALYAGLRYAFSRGGPRDQAYHNAD